MESSRYDVLKTPLLFVDPNDDLSAGGNVWPAIQAVVQQLKLLDNLRDIDRLVRAAGVQRIVVPHRRWQEGDDESEPVQALLPQH